MAKSQPGGLSCFISEAGLNQMLKYKYVSGQYSIGDKLFQPFWNWFVTLMPMWLAPNMITLVGLIFNMIGLVIMLAMDTSMTEVLPVGVYLFGTLTLFIYQTMDAIDGKQARRTGAAGPLGQLFDHGCDALTTNLAGNILFQTLLLGRDPDLTAFFCLTLASHTTFYLAQWEEQHTHILRSNCFGIFGVTEIQWLQMGLILFNTLSAQYLSNTLCGDLVPILGLTAPYVATKNLAWVFGFMGMAPAIPQSLFSIINVLSTLGFSGFFKEGYQGLVPLIQWYIALLFTFLDTEWAWLHPSLALLLLLPGYGLINSKLIVCNVTNMETDANSWVFIWFLLFPLNRRILDLMFPEWALALVIFLANLTAYLTFAVCTIEQITSFLDIHCLTIKHKKKSP